MLSTAAIFLFMKLLQPDQVGYPIEDLIAIARKGDKSAQIALGDRYFSEKNERQARKWYCRAAKGAVTRRYVYSAPVGSSQSGRVIEIGPKKRFPGSLLAEQRLKMLSPKFSRCN